MKECSS